MVAVGLLVSLGYVHSVAIPARIEAVKDVGRRMPTLQIVTIERVEAWEHWRTITRWLIAFQLVVIFVLVRSMW
jgi:hypothetical protein